MGPSPWHHLPMPVLLAFTTITLPLRTPLIIIGAADVAFNRLFVVLVSMMLPRYELRALDFVSLSLPALHNLIVHHPPSNFLHAHIQTTLRIFWTRSIHPPRMSFSFSTISSEALLFLHRTVSHHSTGFEFGLQLCTCNMMQLSYEFSAGDQFPRGR
jgi:hypothetical protein